MDRTLHDKASARAVAPGRAGEIRETLERVTQRGAEGSTALDELDRRVGRDTASGSGGEMAQQPDPDADGVRPLLERLAATTDPMEVALLAQELEEQAPGRYREQVVDAARQALHRAAQNPPEERPDVSPVFEMLEAFGGDSAVETLEQESAWQQYSLMALAGMRDGQGIPALIASASDPRIAIEQRPQLPFQMLAQAAAEYPDAGEALIDLARSDQIPERAWGSVGSALEGMHLKFRHGLFDQSGATNGSDAIAEAPRLGGFESDAHDVQYELRLMSTTWSEEQIARQIDLIDQLIEATGSADARQVLNDARVSLLGGAG